MENISKEKINSEEKTNSEGKTKIEEIEKELNRVEELIKQTEELLKTYSVTGFNVSKDEEKIKRAKHLSNLFKELGIKKACSCKTCGNKKEENQFYTDKKLGEVLIKVANTLVKKNVSDMEACLTDSNNNTKTLKIQLLNVE